MKGRAKMRKTTMRKGMKKKKKWLPIVVKNLVVIINQKGHPVSPKNSLSLPKKETKFGSYVTEILTCAFASQSLPNVNPSEQDINAMRKSLN